MDLNAQIYGGDGAALYDGENHAPMGVCGLLSAIWLWLLALPRAMMRADFAFDDSRPKGRSFPANRELRARLARFENRPVPPARNHNVLRKLYGRGLSRTQFLERLCRLSVDGRINVYRMPYWSSRAAREAFMAIFTRGDFRMPDGLCAVRLGPD